MKTIETTYTCTSCETEFKPDPGKPYVPPSHFLEQHRLVCPTPGPKPIRVRVTNEIKED